MHLVTRLGAIRESNIDFPDGKVPCPQAGIVLAIWPVAGVILGSGIGLLPASVLQLSEWMLEY
jgi:hypothetical protein